MKKSLFIGMSLAALFFFSTTSCKKCKSADTNINSGVIINDVIIYPYTGSLVANFSGNWRVDANHDFRNYLQVSFDGGLTRDTVDYSTYNILCLPMSIKCEASFIRDVTVDNLNSMITYTVTANTCASCEQTYSVENFVLVSALPAYPLDFVPVIVEQ